MLLSFFLALMASLYHGSIGMTQETLSAPCNAAELEQFCKKIEALTDSDSIQFSDGHRIPICAMSTLSSARSRKHDMEDEAADEKIKGLFKKLKPKIAAAAEDESLLHNPSQVPDFLNKYSAQIDSQLRQEIAKAAEAKGKIVYPFSNSALSVTYTDKLGITNDELLKQAQSSLSQVFVGGRDESALSPEEKSILNRIKTMQLNVGGSKEFTIGCGGPTHAAYILGTHSIAMPPSLHAYPVESQLRIMSHEVSHSFDRCSASRKLQSIQRNQRAPDTAYTKSRSPYVLEGEEDAASGIVAESFTLTQHPLKSAYDCFTTNAGGSFKSQDGGSGPRCDQKSIDEVFSDWMAAHVVADAIGVDNKIPRNYPIYNFTIKPAKYRIGAELMPVFFQLDQACTDRDETVDYEHPSWAKRYLDITLKNSKIASFLRCPAPKAFCELPKVGAPKPAPVIQRQNNF